MAAHEIPSPDLPPIERLRAIMHLLRAPGGCPWDAEQTHESLVPHLIEEAWEVAEAVESGDTASLVDELGDVLLQPIFHAEVASETGAFDFDDVATAISEKLIRRHPHVFGESAVDTSDGVLTQWEQIKKKEKGTDAKEAEPFLSNAWKHLPALLSAYKIQKKVAKVGFDWPELGPVIDKIREELVETEEALDHNSEPEIAEEIGDLLFAVVNLARKTGHNPEVLLEATNRKFIRRFNTVENGLAAKGVALSDASLDEMDAEWNAAK